MTFSMFFPDENETDRKVKERAIKLRKEIDEKKQGRAIMLDYEVISQDKDHVVVDLQKPKKKDPTVRQFREVSGL